MVLREHRRDTRVKLGLIVEGKSDDRCLRRLLQTCCSGDGPTSIWVRRTNGVGDSLNAKKVLATAQALIAEHGSIDRIVVCIDEDCVGDRRAKAANCERELRAAGLGSVSYSLAQQAVEGWLLPDEKAIGVVLGSAMSRLNGDISAECSPKARLRQVFRRHGMRYNAVVHNQAIAEHLNHAVAGGRNPSLSTFLALACNS
ncbi:MAG: DUF4276 family protein [Dehalococcoidia bacterium]|nr:DUF4276 family protein [Dehalococcoidia bacterium]